MIILKETSIRTVSFVMTVKFLVFLIIRFTHQKSLLLFAQQSYRITKKPSFIVENQNSLKIKTFKINNI